MAEQASEKRATSYAVLRYVEGQAAWEFVSRDVAAANGRAAIGKVANQQGRYAAVPERSWTEEAVAFEPQPPKLVFSQGLLTDNVAGPSLEPTPDLAEALDEVDAQVAVS